jgi:antitoxin HigA-1
LERLVLRPLALNQSETARQLGISRRRVNELVQGQRALSPDTAIRCALAFGLDVSFWLGLQARWDSYHHWHSLRQASAPAHAHTPAPAPAPASARIPRG